MQVNGTAITVVKGDVTLTELDAFVFYTTDNLKLGTGFGNAVMMRAGAAVQEELNELAPLASTEAVVTGAGELPASYIVHANGPKFQEPDLEEKLRKTVQNTLIAAERKGITRIAFPPMGTGFYGIPLPLCAKVMVNEFTNHAHRGSAIKELQIVVMNRREFEPFAELLHQEEVAA